VTARNTPRTELEAALARALAGEVRFDDTTRHIFSTDASMYAIMPIGVVFPRNADDITATVEIARRFGVPVLARGGGTSLAGQTVAQAVVVDCSRHMHGILSIDAESRTARVQPGVVQDELNLAARDHGLMFAPDTSTSNRATLGGMIGNNSCGSRSARYGMTIDHVDSLDVVLSDASRARLSAVTAEEVDRRARGATLEARLYRELPALIAGSAGTIRSGLPPYWRRSGGYRVERLLPEQGPFDLAKLVTGSEGTLAITVEATLRLVPVPGSVAAVAGHFDSVSAALAAVDDAIDAMAAAIELVDDAILGLARRSSLHSHLLSVLEGKPGALLWVEFYGDSPAEAGAAADALERRWRAARHGYAVVRATTPVDLKRFRELRKAGLGLLSAAGEGEERSLAFVEDTAVDPRRLAEYTARFARILERHGLRAGFYGHASAGCLHIRPFMNLRRPGEVATMRAVAEEVAALVAEFGGMNSSEHGDGLARAEFSRRLFGDALYQTMREVKRIFDPENRLNPGKKVDPSAMTEHLRDPALPAVRPLATHFPFATEDGMRGSANRCARIGACRKSAESGGTMCPSFMATRDETHSTRGRANALVRALSAVDPRAAMADPELHEALALCLECKACKLECPLSIDMATMKSEMLAQTYAQTGVPLAARLFGHARAVNRIGAAAAPLANALGSWTPARWVAERFTGLDRRRPLPRFARETLPTWFARREVARSNGAGAAGARVASRGEVAFLADSFTSYTEPGIGTAAIELLERAGWSVRLVDDVCCGRALISKGLLTEAKARHAALVQRLAPVATAGSPIVGCEPSCVFTMKDELPALGRWSDPFVAVGRETRLVEELLLEALDDGALAIDASWRRPPILFHGHCHQRAASALEPTVALLRRLSNDVTVLDAGCCGMAGSFGMVREHYELSMRIGGMRLFPAVRGAPAGALIAATGVSCRQQIAHGTGRRAEHPVTLLHRALSPCKPPPSRPAH
jgi:FAD/FMN-containing dehydrogenase/Fe-S oxidoreductase